WPPQMSSSASPDARVSTHEYHCCTIFDRHPLYPRAGLIPKCGYLADAKCLPERGSSSSYGQEHSDLQDSSFYRRDPVSHLFLGMDATDVDLSRGRAWEAPCLCA